MGPFGRQCARSRSGSLHGRKFPVVLKASVSPEAAQQMHTLSQNSFF